MTRSYRKGSAAAPERAGELDVRGRSTPSS